MFRFIDLDDENTRTNIMMFLWFLEILTLPPAYDTIPSAFPPLYPDDWQLPVVLASHLFIWVVLGKGKLSRTIKYRWIVFVSIIIETAIIVYRSWLSGQGV